MDAPGVTREKRLEKLGMHASDTALLAFQDVRVPDGAVLGQIGKGGEYPVREISMAKLHASRIAVEVADECIQIHGGAGYMKEYGVERVWRDLRLNRIGAGTGEIMLDVIGRSYGL
jgi:alkylation response protein AidB-like acyl-CoA dehydrogenase